MEFLETLSQFGIDVWSMVFYLVNFGVLLVVLTFLLYRPILSFLEKRQKAIADSVTEADELKKLLEEERAEMKRTKEQAQAELKAEVEHVKKTLREQEEKLTKDMEDKRSAMLAEAKAQIDAEKAALLKDAEAKTLSIIKEVVLYVVQNKVPQDVVHASVEEAWSSYKS